MGVELLVWRHPLPRAVAGLCIGRTDAAVDARKARRLAHRIRHHARRRGLQRLVFTSPLRRSADVGRWLARWGWQHIVDERLSEMDFGAWDGRGWDEIGSAAVDAWCIDFSHHAPGAGESVAALFARCEEFIAAVRTHRSLCVVGHAGWMSAARLLAQGRGVPSSASDWPRAACYGERVTLRT